MAGVTGSDGLMDATSKAGAAAGFCANKPPVASAQQIVIADYCCPAIALKSANKCFPINRIDLS
jgi:hypothetical protein